MLKDRGPLALEQGELSHISRPRGSPNLSEYTVTACHSSLSQLVTAHREWQRAPASGAGA